MTDFINAFLLVYAGLFPILNPIGSAPIFLGLTSGCSEGERNVLARRVALNSVLLLAGSMFVGTHLLVFFGITLPAFEIAGGIILILMGLEMLQGRRSATHEAWKRACACEGSSPALVASSSERSASRAAASQSRRNWWHRDRHSCACALSSGRGRGACSFSSSARVKSDVASGTSALFRATQPWR